MSATNSSPLHATQPSVQLPPQDPSTESSSHEPHVGATAENDKPECQTCVNCVNHPVLGHGLCMEHFLKTMCDRCGMHNKANGSNYCSPCYRRCPCNKYQKMDGFDRCENCLDPCHGCKKYHRIVGTPYCLYCHGACHGCRKIYLGLVFGTNYCDQCYLNVV